MDLSTVETVRLNIGAGSKPLPGFLSVGLEDHHDIKTDIRALPLPDECAEEAVAIHVLEHLNRWEAPAALSEWRRVLKMGGKLVLELPELRKCCKAILRNYPEQEGVMGLFGDPSLKDEMMMHRWSWLERELVQELKAVGFKRVETGKPQFHGKREHRDMRVEAWK